MIALVSDIHGNFPALKEVLTEIDRLGCRRIFSLGDVAGYYCMVNECIDALREREVIHLLGNHDFYLINGLPCPRSKSATLCLKYQEREISGINLLWLRKAVTTLVQDGMSMVHGGWADPIDEYLYEPDEEYFSGLPGEIFLSGHTHFQRLLRFSGKTYANPGSVGQPRDGDPTAAFAVISEGQILLRRVAYDIDAIAFAMKRNGFDSRIYENLYKGLRIGERPSAVRSGPPA